MDPQHGKTYTLHVWQDKSEGRRMRADPWTDGYFSPDFDAGGEGTPSGIAVAVSHSHNQEPKHTLQIVLRDPIMGFKPLVVSFNKIDNGYSPAGQARWIIHRDYPWQDVMLKVLGIVNGKLTRVYTWWYIVPRQFRWHQPDPTLPGVWVQV